MNGSLDPDRRDQVARQVEEAVLNTPVRDIHTHLYDPAFGDLLLWGIDDLLTYHYLVAEVFRYLDLPYEQFWRLSKTARAELIWEVLFLDHSPLSEACRGVLTVLSSLGLDVKRRDLKSLRQWFARQSPEKYITHCMEVAKVEAIYMTNSPFDDAERRVWEKGFRRDARFHAGLRIDPLLFEWPKSAQQLKAWGFKAEPRISPRTIAGVRKFLVHWTKKLDARYLMVSLPADFVHPSDTEASALIEKAILPHCREFGLPFAVMPGVRRAVNPELRLAGDGVGASDLRGVGHLCRNFPENKFLVTVLARENQHELCVLARKFRNLHIFGCWWFTNTPYLIEEITRMRLELVGTSFTAQHSDARVLDQLIYKWQHSRAVIAPILTQKYVALEKTGWRSSREEIERDVKELLGGAFETFCKR